MCQNRLCWGSSGSGWDRSASISLSPAAAARAALLQNGGLAAVQPGQMQRLLRAPAVLRRDIRAALHHNGAALPLRRLARRGQSAQLLRTDRDEVVALHERNGLHDGLRFAVIPAADAEQTGADQNVFHSIGSFLRHVPAAAASLRKAFEGSCFPHYSRRTFKTQSQLPKTARF